MTDQFLRFQIGNTLFAADINQINKVIKTREITPIKRGPRFLLGSIKFDGSQVLIINLRKIFGFKDAPESTLAIIIDLDDKKIAYQVDGIDGVFRYPKTSRPPKNLKIPGFFTAIILDEDKIIQVVDFNRIFGKRQKSILLKIIKEKK